MDLCITPIKVERLASLLYEYPNGLVKTELIDGFTNGFSLHYFGPRLKTDCSNLISVKQNEEKALKLVMKEVEAGRRSGPFNKQPFENF